jgi:acyl dehydratase
MPRFEDVNVGQQIPEQSEVVDQARLLRYAGASGDFNPLHWEPVFAAQVSPTGGVIAHGMLSMGLVSRAVTHWAGGPEHVRALSAAFRAPCPVGSTLRCGAEVVEVDPDARTATLVVWAEVEGGRAVIDRRRSRAVVQLG